MEIADRLLYSTKMLMGTLDWICAGVNNDLNETEIVKVVAQDLLVSAEHFLQNGNEQASVENYWLAGYLFEKIGLPHMQETVRRVAQHDCNIFAHRDLVFAAFVFCHELEGQSSIPKIQEMRKDMRQSFGDNQYSSVKELYNKLDGYCERRVKDLRRAEYEQKMVERCALLIMEGDECVERHEISAAANKYCEAAEIFKYQLNMPCAADDMPKKRIESQYIAHFGAMPTLEEIEAANIKARSS
ncbi:hypothetical protein HZB03_03590 [Candidatus Woesearchaeota archaeon]|nr:hypothetical protein [Candidatus Woesearchaeota archaeon]